MNGSNKITANKQVQEDHQEEKKNTVDNVYSGLDRGWSWMVLLASFGSYCFIGGALLSVGIIHSTLLERFHESVYLTSWAGALYSALSLGGAPLSSALIDRFSCRAAIVASGVCLVVGYLGTAFATSIEAAIFTCGIIAGIGCAFGYTASMVVIGFNFHRRRNTALGVAISGIGAGCFVMAPLLQLSRNYYGTSGLFIILAAIASNVITFGVMCFPSKLEVHAQMKRKQDTKKIENTKSCVSLRNYRKVVLNKATMCLCFSMFIHSIGAFLLCLHLPEYIVLKGSSAEEASYIVSISGALNVAGRFLTGYIANLKIVDDVVLFSGSMTLLSLGTFSFPLYSGHFAGLIVFSVIQGLFMGSCYVVMTSINIKSVGVTYMSAANGLAFGFGGMGALLGPVLAGIIVDSGGTYDQSFIVAGSAFLLAALLGAITVCFPTAAIETNSTDNDVLKQEMKIMIKTDGSFT